MPIIADVAAFLERFAPRALAGEWDNVGLLLGDRSSPVERLMTCLTVTPVTAQEAVDAGVQLIVSHHPILFRPVQRLTTSNPEGRMLLTLARAGVAVYSPHSAFDNTAGGINDSLARRLGLCDVRPLRTAVAEAQCKLVVFVPDSDLDRVSAALFAAGAGQIGQYSQCSFRLAGTGTFFGSDATSPTVGQKGRREEVNEWRLEVVCPDKAVDRVLAALRDAHSYEEPAYDIYPLRAKPAVLGEGRIGRLAQPLPLGDLADRVRLALNTSHMQATGAIPRKAVDRVALACGAGGSFLKDAVRAGADLFLTGEMRFHDCLTAEAEGLAVLLPGHYATERFGVEELAGRLQEEWPQLKVWASAREKDPVYLL